MCNISICPGMLLYNPMPITRQCANHYRWHVYDTMTHLIYGKSVGMVQSGCDVDGLISEWHHMFTLGGVVATLPWLIRPLITNQWLKKFLMPTKGDSRGSGHIMSVSEATVLVRVFGVLKWLRFISVARKTVQISSGKSSIGS